MTISYNWLSEYLPWPIEPEKLSKILTSIGLEVESLTFYENVKGGLAGLVVGEVITVTQHPNADKLKITTVHIGAEAPLQIVCGASNARQGIKVACALVGAKLPSIDIKEAKVRGVESFGMLCSLKELGLAEEAEGILELSHDLKNGTDLRVALDPVSYTHLTLPTSDLV